MRNLDGPSLRSAWLQLYLPLFLLLCYLPSAAALADEVPPPPSPYVFIVLDTSGSMNGTPFCNHIDAATDADPFDGSCTTRCTMSDETCGRVCPDYGCAEYDAASLPDPADMVPIVIDNLDPAPFFTRLNTPSQVLGRAHYSHGSDSFEDSTSYLPGSSTDIDPATDSAFYAPKTFGNRFTFSPTLDHEGLWHVYAYWTGLSSNATNSRFEISYFDGSVQRTKLLEIDQKTARTGFAFLATIDFRADTGGIPASVTIRNTNELNQLVANGNILADAVAFVPVPLASESNTCLETAFLCRQPLCPDGDCHAPMAGDDPTSKFFQVKQALDEAIATRASDVNFGFATFEQDNARVQFKHWFYEALGTDLSGNSVPPVFEFPDGTGTTLPFPEPGRIDVLGTGGPYSSTGRTTSDNNGFHCASSTSSSPDSNLIGCTSTYPADVRDLWEMMRLSLIPKLGKTGSVGTPLFVRSFDGSSFKVYRVDWKPMSGGFYKLGDPIFGLRMDVIRCGNLSADPTCSNYSYSPKLVSNAPVYYRLVGDAAPYNSLIGRFPMNGYGFFNSQGAVQSDNTCLGLEPNEDWNLTTTSPATDDTWYNYAYKHPQIFNVLGDVYPDLSPRPYHVGYFDRGDFIPLDWNDTHAEIIQSYLTPNKFAGVGGSASSADPDYRISAYFHDEVLSLDSPATLDRRLRLRDDVYEVAPGFWQPTANPPSAVEPKQRPLVAMGATPIFQSVRNFKAWYLGWKETAEVLDLDFALRAKYLVFISDGDETCETTNSVCGANSDIHYLADVLQPEEQVRTYAVGFGMAGSDDALTCMASDGATGPNHAPGDPFWARNLKELKEALQNIFTAALSGNP